MTKEKPSPDAVKANNMKENAPQADKVPAAPKKQTQKEKQKEAQKPQEHGGPSGPEPTRYGDWERGGKCVDF